ncbi:MAG: transporter, partial [Pseudomonadota bacterium]
GILQDSRDLTLELDIGYTRTDRLVGIPIAPGFGLATLAESKTEALVTGLTARYSLTDDLEVSATGQVENVRQELKFGTTSSSQHSSRFGDVALAARYQAVREGPNTPGVVVSADTRLPTDDDRAFALGGGVSLVKRSDPAVLFAAGSYLHTFSDETNDPLRLQPENSYALRAGLSLGLNEALSVNGSFEFDADEATSFDNGLTLPARETFGLRFGVTSLINRNLYLEPSVRLQVNDVANSVTFNLGIPYTFR